MIRESPRAVHLDALLAAAGIAIFGVLGVLTGSPLPPLEELPMSLLTFVGFLTGVLIDGIRQRRLRVAEAFVHWCPALFALVAYESASALYGNVAGQWLGILPKDGWMIGADRLLFGDVLPLRLEPLATTRVVRVMQGFEQGVYRAAPLTALALAYWAARDFESFISLRKTLVLVLFVGFALHVLMPVEGPLFAIGERFTSGIATQPIVHRLRFAELRHQRDCFPSLEAAVPWALTFVGFRRLHTFGRALAVAVSFGTALSGVLLRHQYGFDVVAGVCFAALVAGAVSTMRIVRERVSVDTCRPSALRFTGPHRRLILLALLFVLTGGAALLAEQTFEKLLGTLIGASTPAAAIVLSAYFMGLTLGAALYAACSSKIRNPLFVYAVLEAGVAAWALLLFLGYERLIAWYSPVFALGAGSAWKLGALRVAVACSWILPPTALMGATFPAVVDSLEMLRVPEPKRMMSRFYALNLLGAVFGAVLGPYVFFPQWGLDGTLLLTAGVDGFAAAAALGLSRSRNWRRARWSAKPMAETARAARAPIPLLLLGLALVSGFLLFSLEVSWTHLMSVAIGSSVYAFAAMLSLVLLGLLIGGAAAVRARASTEEDSVSASTVAIAFALGGILVSVQTAFWPHVPGRFSVAAPLIQSFWQSELFRWVQLGLQILPAAAVLGFVYPALFRLREFPNAQRARIAGWMAGANAVGCCSGALLTAFALIPALGSQGSFKACSILCAVAGAALGVAFGSRAQRLRVLLLASGSLVLALCMPAWDRLALTSGEHVFFRRGFVWPQSRLEFFHEDAFGGITTVVDNPQGVQGAPRAFRTLLTNGKFQGNDSGETDAQLGFALIPSLYVARPERACVIGFGTGQSASVPAALGFSRIAIAELSPGILRAAPYFSHLNRNVLLRRGVSIELEDGRNLLLIHPELRCDLVSIEITSIWFAGATNVYSRQFYELTRARLAPGGVLQQWIQLHHIGLAELGSVIATIRAVYPQVSLWVFGGQGIVVASVSPQALRTQAIQRYFSNANRLGLTEDRASRLFTEVLSSRLLAPAEVEALVRHSQFVLNTDRNRHLEYATARYNVSRFDHARYNLRALARWARWAPHRPPPDLPARYRDLVEHAAPVLPEWLR